MQENPPYPPFSKGGKNIMIKFYFFHREKRIIILHFYRGEKKILMNPPFEKGG